MSVLKLDEVELQSRRAFFEISDEDLTHLASLREYAEQCTDEVVEGFYELLLKHPETRSFLQDESMVRRLKRTQRDYFLGLFAGKCDLTYVEDRLRVGAAHERIGLAPKWYLGSYRRYLQLVHSRLFKDLEQDAAIRAYYAIMRLVYFDQALAIDTYIAANLEALDRHRAAIRELSTPVIRVYDEVLLLPLVGTVDSLRAHQVMESVLLRVVEEQARCVIIDIAGVPVVDTKVAGHLVRTTAAIKLLGAETILTGISAQIARTMVQLGVDLSTMHTLPRLANGIELALSIIGKQIQSKAEPEAASAQKASDE